MMRAVVLIMGLLLCISSAVAQSFEEVWKKAMKPFYTESFDIEIGIRIYRNALRISLLESTDMRYRKTHDALLVTSGQYDQLTTDKVKAIADHQERVLMLGPVLNGRGANPLMGLDSLFGITKTIFSDYGFTEPERIKKPDGTQGFIFVEPNDYYTRAEFWFDENLEKVTRIVVLPSEDLQPGIATKEIPEVEYQFVYRTTPPDKKLFSLDQFVLRSSGTYVPAKKYASYTLLNQL